MPGKDNKVNLDDAMTAAQLEKLQLEIRQLKNKNEWTDKIAPYTSLFTVIIAVSGFIFGIVQFRSQQDAQIQEREKYRIGQDREAKTKLQERFKTDLDKLLGFTQDEQISPAQTKLLLIDVRECLKLQAAYESNGEFTRHSTREVTEMLVQSLVYGCDLTQARHLNVAEILFNDWLDLGTYFHEQHYYGYVLLNRHKVALAKLYKKAPEAVRNISYDAEDETYYFSPNDKFEDPDEDAFVQLAANYLYLYRPIDATDENIRNNKQPVKDFQIATCNKTLTKEMFGINFDMTGDADFDDCKKLELTEKRIK